MREFVAVSENNTHEAPGPIVTGMALVLRQLKARNGMWKMRCTHFWVVFNDAVMIQISVHIGIISSDSSLIL